METFKVWSLVALAMHHWHATWQADASTPEKRHVTFAADYETLSPAQIVREAYRTTRRQNVIDGYALQRYWELRSLVGTYAPLADTLNESVYPDLTAWLDDHDAVQDVRPRTFEVDCILDTKADARRVAGELADWLDADPETSIDRIMTRKPGTKGTQTSAIRLQIRTQLTLDVDSV